MNKLIAVLLMISLVCPVQVSYAFGKGLSQKVRAMQRHAFNTRLDNAQVAYENKDYRMAIKQAKLALSHVQNMNQELKTRDLLLSAYADAGEWGLANDQVEWLLANSQDKAAKREYKIIKKNLSKKL